MRRFRATTISLALAIAAPSPARAIIGGTPLQAASADAIVLLYDDSQGTGCSGAVVAPRVVVTSASCVGDPVAAHYFVLGGVNALLFPDFTVPVSAVHQHPAYDPNGAVHDIGVAITAADLPATPLAWLATDDGSYAPGLSANVFGFGVTGPLADDSGIRRGGTARIAQDGGGGLFTTDYSTGQGPCFGDTGGPAMPANSILGDVVMGVVSFGDQSCSQFTAYTRTDANADFLSLYAPEPPGEEGALAAMAGVIVLCRRRASR